MFSIQLKKKSEKAKGKSKFSFQCYGVRISISSNRANLIEKVKREMPHIFPIKWKEIPENRIKHEFQIFKDYKTKQIKISKDEEFVYEGPDLKRALEMLVSKLRLTVAEFAEKIVFLHAGVVGWKGKAILIPGKSFAGKTTLVAEFAKNGCEYFSDEYALIDKKGLVHPFPKKLSMRGIVDDYTQIDTDVEAFGGKSTTKPFPVGYVLVAEYKKTKNLKVRIQKISLGEGVMACIANSISIRQNPRFVIEVLNKALSQSIAVKSVRGDAKVFVKKFFNLLDSADENRDL